jgi:drug/metabolite transporter (DMT)-like permease
MAQVMAFAAGLIMGTGSTLTIKIAYSLNGTDSNGNVRPFEKPLSTTFLMFVAMSVSLPIYCLIQLWTKCCQKQKKMKSPKTQHDPINSPLLTTNNYQEEQINVVQEEQQDEGLSTRLFFLLLVPALFDLIGTALAKVGLMYCDVSTYQLVRCTVIVFTAVAKQCLGERLPKHVWFGVGLITVAMVFVSVSSLIEAADDASATASSGLKKDPKIGIVFLLMSCIVASLQYVFEEKIMTDDGAHPLIVVGKLQYIFKFFLTFSGWCGILKSFYNYLYPIFGISWGCNYTK